MCTLAWQNLEWTLLSTLDFELRLVVFYTRRWFRVVLYFSLTEIVHSFMTDNVAIVYSCMTESRMDAVSILDFVLRDLRILHSYRKASSNIAAIIFAVSKLAILIQR